MSSSCKKKSLVRRPAVLDLGCSCRRTKLSHLFSSTLSKPKLAPPSGPKHHHHHPPSFWSYYPFSPSNATTAATSPSYTTTTTSPFYTSRQPSSTAATTPSPYDEHTSMKQKPTRGPAGRVAESVAVVKESEDPYLDFRESMLQMIVEKEIFAWEDLRDLLHLFLALNSPYHHDAIVRAFSEVYTGIFSGAAAIAAAT